MAIHPFKVHIPEPVILDLRNRIRQTRWPDEVRNSGWTFGADLSYTKELADYWLTNFEWREIEHSINAHQNFIADIDGYKIHFLHIKGRGKKSIPLLALHGWPGSFLELMKLIPLLTQDEEQTFDLVIPSMIGYGFSQKITDPGCDLHFMAGLYCTLMKELHYENFGVHGGDFGSGLGMALALKFPQNVMGLHVNNIEGYSPLHLTKDDFVQVPLGVIHFPKEDAFPPRTFVERGFNVRRWTTMPVGGHFASMEQPVLLAEDITEFFHTLEGV